MTPPIRPLLLVTLLLLTPASWAIDYRVEVVIFENRQPDGAVVPGSLYVPTTRGAIALGDTTATAAGFRVLASDELTLDNSSNRINGSRRYRVLGHFGWQQPGLDNDSALAIRIGLGSLSTLYVGSASSSAEGFIPANLQPTPERSRDVRIPTVYGTLKVRLGRFLHLDSQLVYTDADNGRGYRLSQSRKMRSRELHYIDNERFGILTRILPVEEPEAAEPDDDATDETGDPSAPAAGSDAATGQQPQGGDTGAVDAGAATTAAPAASE